MDEKDQHFIKIAIALSEDGMNSEKGGPFGAIIVKDGEIIGFFVEELDLSAQLFIKAKGS